MSKIITYSLRNEGKRSDQYSTDIAEFSDTVLAEIQGWAGERIEDYRRFIQERDLEKRRSFEEYAFELLTLGTLWRVYMQQASLLTPVPKKALSSLGKWRKQYPTLKPGIDWLRGLLGGIYLTSKNGRMTHIPGASLENLCLLLDWMAATGELNQEFKRLRLWQVYLESLVPEKGTGVIEIAIQLGGWFEKCSLATLGKYTPNVEQFLEEQHPKYRWREDVIMCGRKRVEYHLNMVGTEILNRAFRAGFLQTDQKVVLLPPCMKAKPEDECKAQDTPLGQRCAACTPGCRVHQTTRLGEKHGFAVYIMAHELSVFSNGDLKPAADKNIGILGVSCPLTNVTGGWETKDLGLPAQGLLLDYCGCPWHWHDEGIPTDINFNQLLAVINGDKNVNMAKKTKGWWYQVNDFI